MAVPSAPARHRPISSDLDEISRPTATHGDGRPRLPALAQSASRAAAPVAEASEMAGESTLLLVLAVVLFGAGIFFLVDNDDDNPDSP